MRPGESKIPSHGRMNVHQANSKRGQKKFREERWPSFAIIDAIIPCSLLLSWLQTQTILLTCFSLFVFFVRAAGGVASPLVVQACFNHLRIPCAGKGRFGRSMSAGDALEHARSEAAIAIVCFTRLGCSTHNKADCCAAH